jgi:hypothetical protein
MPGGPTMKIMGLGGLWRDVKGFKTLVPDVDLECVEIVIVRLEHERWASPIFALAPLTIPAPLEK